jgi:hypothetical protein
MAIKFLAIVSQWGEGPFSLRTFQKLSPKGMKTGSTFIPKCSLLIYLQG